ncbi:DUF6301 family protein [Dactylosporangium siamense]|uniref:Uncharacterized protein n=1 Tax=Dactylosporangium siamense TaxID=685454 RepID=A0A919UEH5_9ACTN|nr:DUF6301 family protein [Dactylosporangium siamense]GIG52602.1 hypothetical protein Dsi01nite_106430 [Dactylosporangium siamense]
MNARQYWRVIDGDTLRRLLAAIRTEHWSWTADQVPLLAERLGWNIVLVLDGKGAVAEAGWNVGDPEEIEIAYSGATVDDITMRLTDTVPTKQAEARIFAQDAFAAAVAVAAEVLGPPTSRVLGRAQQARWRSADTTIMVKHNKAAINLAWANNAFQDRWDNLREEPT